MADFKRTGNLHVPEIPDYFKYLRPDSMLSYADVTKVFGFIDPHTCGCMASAGTFPKPDKHISGLSAPKRAFWFKKTILAEIARRKQVRAELDAWRAAQAADTTITDDHATTTEETQHV